MGRVQGGGHILKSLPQHRTSGEDPTPDLATKSPTLQPGLCWILLESLTLNTGFLMI